MRAGRRTAGIGGAMIESLLLIPVMVLLFIGAMEMGKVTLTYYQLHKALRGGARMAALLRGADFCSAEDPQLAAVKNFIVFGPDGTTEPIVRGLTAEQVALIPERAQSDGSVGACECAGPAGCSLADGGRAPDYVAAEIDGGYEHQVRIPFRTPAAVILRPRVRAPFGGL
jgi:hypothetical protein